MAQTQNTSQTIQIKSMVDSFLKKIAEYISKKHGDEYNLQPVACEEYGNCHYLGFQKGFSKIYIYTVEEEDDKVLKIVVYPYKYEESFELAFPISKMIENGIKELEINIYSGSAKTKFEINDIEKLYDLDIEVRDATSIEVKEVLGTLEIETTCFLH